jgi:uncharacterized membrane protein YheB (UPF0754 family)
MNTVLFWLLPPIVGAGIGFLTNVLAIKMLFRPLEEVRIGRRRKNGVLYGGFRLPFTPGILPRGRARLAESIGSMVERELLTPEILDERLGRDDVRFLVQNGVSAIIDKVFDEGISGFGGAEPLVEMLKKEIPAIIKKNYDGIVKAAAGFLRRPDIKSILEEWGGKFLEKAMEDLPSSVRFLVTLGGFEKSFKDRMPKFIDSLISSLEETLGEEKNRSRIIDVISEKAGELLSKKNVGGRPLSAVIDVSREFKMSLAAFASAKILTFTTAKIPAALDAVNIKQMVSDRINALPMERVEGIVLDVMARELKWIDVFGAILGFLIGLFQASLSFVLR